MEVQPPLCSNLISQRMEVEPPLCGFELRYSEYLKRCKRKYFVLSAILKDFLILFKKRAWV